MVEAHGDGHLEAITLADIDTGAREEVATNFLFAFIGAAPRTAWLGNEIARDDKGFVITGRGVLANCEVSRWPLICETRFLSRRACRASSPRATCASIR